MSKPLHGYITKPTLESQETDKQLSLSWTSNKYITSHSNHMLLQLVSKKSILKTLITEETKHKIQLFTSITNVDFARPVLKMFSIFYAGVQKCQADTAYHATS